MGGNGRWESEDKRVPIFDIWTLKNPTPLHSLKVSGSLRMASATPEGGRIGKTWGERATNLDVWICFSRDKGSLPFPSSSATLPLLGSLPSCQVLVLTVHSHQPKAFPRIISTPQIFGTLDGSMKTSFLLHEQISKTKL